MIGTRLGPYEITAKLGEGGMGEVYRATDTRLKREVAIKVLPAAFIADKERLARFEREAQLLAQLNHPNIAQIFGLEASGETHALVMELVPGPTLAERLEAGAFSITESLSFALQIAQALEEAHEKGIVHRDLKPQNIKTSSEGRVKVLDFGLAKAMDAASGSAPAADLARSPTLTQGATAMGMILGTAAYMSPEQAKGMTVDRRTDIWAFGVVLYEMLSGRRLFAGDSVTEILASVLRNEIDFAALPAGTPPAIRRLLRQCLDRSPKNRLHEIADARILLEDLERLGSDDSGPVARASAGRSRHGWLKWGAVAAAVLIVGALGGWAFGRLRAPLASPKPDYHILSLERGFIHSARFAPDGATIVYGEARLGGPVALFTTRADATVSRELDAPSADVVGIAANGAMVLILDRHYAGSWQRVGILAQAALAGGAPRALLEGIFDADIAPDGASLAIVRADGTGQQLEFPIGKVLHRTNGWISAPRISRDGRRVAFVDHPIPGDDQGMVAVVEPGSVAKILSDALNFLHGVAWSADGGEILASHGSTRDGGFVTAFSPGRPPRTVLRQMTTVRLHDVAANGTILLTDDSVPVSMEGRLAAGAAQLDFASGTGATIDGISEDGQIVVGTVGGVIEQGEYRSFFRRGNAGDDIDLGVGGAAGVSPDGRWAYLSTQRRDRSKLRMVPTGPGDTRILDFGDVELELSSQDPVSVSATGRRIAFRGRRGNEEPRGFVFEVDASGPPRAVTPPGVREVRLSPDGRLAVAADREGALALYPTEGGEKRAVPGVVAGEIALAWSSASDALFVWDRRIPARVERLDLATGKRQPAFEWRPGGSAQALYGLLSVTTDARYYMVRFRGGVSSLVVVRNAR